MFLTPVGRFRVVAFAEGISAILLFGVAMPIKYVDALGRDPLPTRYVGWGHGVLVMVFALAGVNAYLARRWGPMAAVYGFLAAMIPGGTFVYDAKFLKPEHDRERAGRAAASGLQNTD